MKRGLIHTLRDRPMKRIAQACAHCGQPLVMVQVDGTRVKFLYACVNCDNGNGQFPHTTDDDNTEDETDAEGDATE